MEFTRSYRRSAYAGYDARAAPAASQSDSDSHSDSKVWSKRRFMSICSTRPAGSVKRSSYGRSKGSYPRKAESYSCSDSDSHSDRKMRPQRRYMSSIPTRSASGVKRSPHGPSKRSTGSYGLSKRCSAFRDPSFVRKHRSKSSAMKRRRSKSSSVGRRRRSGSSKKSPSQWSSNSEDATPTIQPGDPYQAGVVEAKLPTAKCDPKVHAKWPRCGRCLSVSISKCAQCQHPIETMKALETATHRKRFWIRFSQQKPALAPSAPGGPPPEQSAQSTALVLKPPPEELYKLYGLRDITELHEGAESESESETKLSAICFVCAKICVTTISSDEVHRRQCRQICSIKLAGTASHPQWWPCMWRTDQERKDQRDQFLTKLKDHLVWPRELCLVVARLAIPEEFSRLK